MSEENNAPAQSGGDNGKTVALIAHFTLIGWIIAIIKNNGNKTQLGSFYVRQMLGLIITQFVCGFIPIVNLVSWIVLLVFWIMSIVGASNEEEKLTPGLGPLFQNWFKSL